MTRTILTLRVNRRAIGAVVLQDEDLTLIDGRHLSSRSEKGIGAATRFSKQLIATANPHVLVVDAPRGGSGAITDAAVNAITELARQRGIEVLMVSKPELLATYALRGLRNRRELRDLVRQYWTELSRVKGKVEPYVADAAAAALYADCRIALERVVS